MNPPSDPAPAPATPTSTAAPRLTIAQAATALASPTRWHLLQELAKGEPLPVTVLAQRLGILPDTASKQIAVLRRLGIVHTGYGRLYSLTPPFRPAPGSTSLPLGPCTLHFDPPVLQ